MSTRTAENPIWIRVADSEEVYNTALCHLISASRSRWATGPSRPVRSGVTTNPSVASTRQLPDEGDWDRNPIDDAFGDASDEEPLEDITAVTPENDVVDVVIVDVV